MSGFKLDGEEYFLEYEGLHMLCSGCGIYGHRLETCRSKKTSSNNEKEVDVQMQEKEPVKNKINNNYRDQWKVVQRPRRNRKTKETRGDQSRQDQQGSRYGVLAYVDESANQEGENEEVQFGILQNVGHQQNHDQATTLIRSQMRSKKGTTKRLAGGGHYSNSGAPDELMTDLRENELRRKVEKRTREVRNEKMNSEFLSITVKENIEKNNLDEGKDEHAMDEDQQDVATNRDPPHKDPYNVNLLDHGILDPGDPCMEDMNIGDNTNGPKEIGPVQSDHFDESLVESMVAETPCPMGADLYEL